MYSVIRLSSDIIFCFCLDFMSSFACFFRSFLPCLSDSYLVSFFNSHVFYCLALGFFCSRILILPKTTSKICFIKSDVVVTSEMLAEFNVFTFYCPHGCPPSPYLEQSAPTCRVCTLYVCFPRMSQGFSLLALLSVTLYSNFIVPVQ